MLKIDKSFTVNMKIATIYIFSMIMEFIFMYSLFIKLCTLFFKIYIKTHCTTIIRVLFPLLTNFLPIQISEKIGVKDFV